MPSRSRSILVAASLLGGIAARSAHAEDPQQAGRGDAKALMQSGVRLFEAKDYLGALAVFKDAYSRFQSAKILLNIATTLTLLDRKADAANAYQRYLESADSDPAKKADVLVVLADLDRLLGRLEITVTPADAEVQINDGEWTKAANVTLFRIPQGAFTVRARKDKFQSEAKSASIIIGEKAAIRIDMTALPDAPTVVTGPIGDGNGAIGVLGDTPGDGSRPRLSGIALVHLDIPRGGAAVRVGVGFDVTTQLALQAAALIGPTSGGYAGATFTFLAGSLRPYAAVGLPLFFSEGPRLAVRGGGGLEIVITPHVSLMAEVGIEVLLNPEDDILKAVLIPAIGATGRL
ncbi:MAG: hypothetical protein H0T42_32610 [Deltaproteobacteria bacterium]|nr:hypothetical protein [Deltaproteobacteria bacterium]